MGKIDIGGMLFWLSLLNLPATIWLVSRHRTVRFRFIWARRAHGYEPGV